MAPEPMRILVVSNLYPPDVLGGYELLCAGAAERWARQGHHVTVLTRTGSGSGSAPNPIVHRSLPRPPEPRGRGGRLVFARWRAERLREQERVPRERRHDRNAEGGTA